MATEKTQVGVEPMENENLEAAVRIVEAYIVAKGGAGTPPGIVHDPDGQGDHLGKLFTKVYEAVVAAVIK